MATPKSLVTSVAIVSRTNRKSSCRLCVAHVGDGLAQLLQANRHQGDPQMPRALFTAFQVKELHEPAGWVRIPLTSPGSGGAAAIAADATGDADGPVLRAHFVQICVVAMHQNGRDTHIRQVSCRADIEMLNGFETLNFEEGDC